jgi:hypothetical protein
VSTGSAWARRAAPAAALALGVVTLGLGVASVVLDHLTHQPGTGGLAADAFITAAAAIPITAVATLLAARRPRNPIGWLLLAIIIIDASPTGPVPHPGLPDAPRDAAPGGDGTYADLIGQASAEWGEPWLSLFTPDTMAALLARHGFGAIRDVRQRDMIPAAAWKRSDPLCPVELSHIVHARMCRP